MDGSRDRKPILGLSESVSVTDEIFINLTPGTVSAEGGGEQKKKIDVDERAEHLSAIIKNDQDIIDVIKIFIQCQ